jgi:hypothetical protein
VTVSGQIFICIWESSNKCASLSCLQDPSNKLRKREIVSSFLTEILLDLKEVIEIVYYCSAHYFLL